MLFRLAVAVAIALGLAACQQTIPTPVYQPASASSLSGAIEVLPFTYAPPAGVAPDEFNNGANSWKLQEPVAVYFEKATRQEFRQSGIQTAPGAACELTGTVHDLQARTSYYLTDVTYRLTGPAPFEKRVALKTASTWDFMPADIANYLNKAVAENVGALMADPEFQAAIAADCQK